MHTPVQVTVVEYVSEFFRKYNSRAYGRSISVNAKGGADALMGMLKLVLSKGGREELRIALQCFKAQLTAAVNSPPAARTQQVEELFALLSSLVDAAERLRQFSPVKESISCAVLEEVRWRLFRVLAGDGFSEAADIQRRALDLVFLSYMREQTELQQQQQRHKQLVAGGAASGPPAAGTAAAAAAGAAAASAAEGAGGSLSGRPGSPSKAARLLQRRAAGIAGPDVSSWEGLWCSLAAMPGRRMLPLLQSVMLDLYSGKHIPGTPAAAAAGAATKAAPPLHATNHHQQPQPSGTSNPAAVGAAAPAAAATLAAGGAAAAAVEVEAACGVHAPPQRPADNDAQESSSNGQQQDVGGSPGSAVAAVLAAAQGSAGEDAVHAGSPGQQQQQQQQHQWAAEAATAALDEPGVRAAAAAQAEGGEPPPPPPPPPTAAAAAAAAGLQDTGELLPGSSYTADAEPPAGVVYAPVLDRSVWVSCASSSLCPTETGSTDGAFALSESSLAASAAAGAAAISSAEDVEVDQQQLQACYSPCSSPRGHGRSRFAAKLERLKESVSIGGGGGGGVAGAGWKLPRGWVQQLKHGLDKDKEREQQQQELGSDLDEEQGVDDDQAAGVEDRSSRLEQQLGTECAAVSSAVSITAAASQQQAR